VFELLCALAAAAAGIVFSSDLENGKLKGIWDSLDFVPGRQDDCMLLLGLSKGRLQELGCLVLNWNPDPGW
jgi:hypothetical protein